MGEEIAAAGLEDHRSLVLVHNGFMMGMLALFSGPVIVYWVASLSRMVGVILQK